MIKFANAANVFVPAAKGTIDGFDAGEARRVEVGVMHNLAVEFIAEADLDFVNSAQGIELGDKKRVSAIDLRGKFYNFEVKPTRAARAPCRRGDFAQLRADRRLFQDFCRH